MTDKIFNLLQSQPVLSIVLGFVLAGFLAWVFRGVIVDYIKKKYNLYSEIDIRSTGIMRINSTRLPLGDKNVLVDFTYNLIEDLKE